MIIDAKNILTADMMADFLKEISPTDDVIISIGDFERITKKDGIKEIWKNDAELKSYFEANQDKEFDIVSSNGCMMMLTYYDYTWWLENSRRINKLFKSLELEQIAKQEEQHTVACGFKKPGAIFSIHTFTGSISQCIDFLNKDMKDKALHNVANNYPIMICMNFVQGQKNVWKSYEELKEEGTIV